MVALAPLARARVESEIAPPEKRKTSLDKAALIAKQTKPSPLPASLVQPFAPPNFELTDAEEAAAALAAARAANPMAMAPTGPSDRQLLAEIASKVRPSGTMSMGGTPLLLFGYKPVKTGAHFTVTYKGTDYDLELTQIDGSNFTLRYKGEEITRPIKTGK
ncbi:MAG TPA: hypothetical protein VH309_01880 [Elusimicrobiota bacterium]|nr:hypothetical protein [Elusimicrobiota bacterium]